MSRKGIGVREFEGRAGLAAESGVESLNSTRRSDTHKKLWVIARATHRPIIVSPVVKDWKRP